MTVLSVSDLSSELSFEDHATALAWSPDGRSIATGGDKGRVQLRDARTGARTRTFAGFHGSSVKGSADAVQAVAFDRTGSWLAAVDSTYFAGPQQPFGSVAVWSTSSGRPIFGTARIFRVAVESVAFSPDGSVLVVGLQDGERGRACTPKRQAGPGRSGRLATTF